MMGSIRWNFIAGCVGFVSTFLSSITHNLLTTTLLRSLYSAIILFALVFVFRFILGIALAEGGRPDQPASPDSAGSSETRKGQHFDFTTPDIDQASLLADSATARTSLERTEEEGFKPLDPPKLATRKEPDAETMVKALRHLSED